MSGRPLGRNCRWTLLTAETRTRSWKRSAVYKKRLQVHDQRFDEMVVGSVSRSPKIIPSGDPQFRNLVLWISRSLSRFETQDIKTQPQINH